MSTLNRPTDPFPQDVAGVFEADPMRPPHPPADATAVAFRDETGRIFAYAWIANDHAGPRYCEEAWAWFDAHATTTARRHLTLVAPSRSDEPPSGR